MGQGSLQKKLFAVQQVAVGPLVGDEAMTIPRQDQGQGQQRRESATRGPSPLSLETHCLKCWVLESRAPGDLRGAKGCRNQER